MTLDGPVQAQVCLFCILTVLLVYTSLYPPLPLLHLLPFLYISTPFPASKSRVSRLKKVVNFA